MMAGARAQQTDYSLEVRRSIIAHLIGWAPLTQKISAARIFGEYAANPEFPFIRYGLPVDEPEEASGWMGSAHDVTLHVFFNGPTTDQLHQACRCVIEAMDAWPGVPGTGIVAAEYQGKDTVRDSPAEEPAKYHTAIRYRIAVAA